MRFTTITLAIILAPSSVGAFAPKKVPARINQTVGKSSAAANQGPSKPLFDPLGLYTVNSPERKEGLLQPLEPEQNLSNPVKDPMNLYKEKNEVDNDTPMSLSLPFLKQPAMLDGRLPGDRGFDPFNFSSNSDALQWYRTAEVKHARLAMLAAAGWPLAELFDKQLASLLDLKPLLVLHDRVPSILNGGLDHTPLAFWASALGIAFGIETIGILKEQKAVKAGKSYTPGDLGFDPLRLAGKTYEDRKFMAEAELFNGRLAMLAITGFAMQEWWTQSSVVNDFPIFFKPIWASLEQLQDAAGNGF